MPCDYSKYPADWAERRARILEREGHRCKFCGVPNHAIGYRDESGRFVPTRGNLPHDEAGRGMSYETGERLTVTEARQFLDVMNDHTFGRFGKCDYDGVRWIMIILTVAHLVEDGPLDCPDSDLAALCQKCHNALDAPMRARHRKAKLKARQLVLEVAA